MILYLGLNPSRYLHEQPLLHYPVIRTEKIMSERLLQAKKLWPRFTHVIFTSQTAVRYWFEEKIPFGKSVIAVGRATAIQLEKAGITPLVAQEETQEGVIALLQMMDLKEAFILWPRSTQARPVLEQYLGDSHFILDLYDTHLQRLEPVPDLNEVDEIVFTSPSTVRGFLAIYGSLPRNKILTGIGPVTRQAMMQLKNTQVSIESF